MTADNRTITERDRELFQHRQCANVESHPEHFARSDALSYICPGKPPVSADNRTSDTDTTIEAAAKVTDERTIDAAADVINDAYYAGPSTVPFQDRIARALASAGLLANNTRHNTIIEAAKAWRYAAADDNASLLDVEDALIAALDALGDDR